MIDFMLGALAVVGIGSGLIALIAGFAYAQRMHQNKEHRQ
jgi:hypothetical protein